MKSSQLYCHSPGLWLWNGPTQSHFCETQSSSESPSDSIHPFDTGIGLSLEDQSSLSFLPINLNHFPFCYPSFSKAASSDHPALSCACLRDPKLGKPPQSWRRASLKRGERRCGDIGLSLERLSPGRRALDLGFRHPHANFGRQQTLSDQSWPMGVEVIIAMRSAQSILKGKKQRPNKNNKLIGGELKSICS